jgi:hypothetical protein
MTLSRVKREGEYALDQTLCRRGPTSIYGMLVADLNLNRAVMNVSYAAYACEAAELGRGT